VLFVEDCVLLRMRDGFLFKGVGVVGFDIELLWCYFEFVLCFRECGN